ncbi:MAG: YhdP family protein [Nitrospiria bacterium]
MKKKKTTTWRIIGGLGILLTFLILLTYMTLLIINAKPIQDRILALVSKQSGDIVKFQSINLSLFPLPRISIFNATVTIPGIVTGKIESIRIYPRLMSLLTGKVLISRIRIDSPGFIVELSEKQAKDNTTVSSNMLGEIETDLAPPIAFLQSIAPNLILQVKQGSLILRIDKRDLSTVHNITGRFGLIPNGLNISITGEAKRWGHVSASGQFIAGDNSVIFKELSVSASRSSVSGISARFRWETTPFVEIISGKGVIDLDYLFKRRLLFEGIRDSLQEVKELKGTIRFTEMNFAGPLLHSEEWQMKSMGEIDQVVVDSVRLPGPLNVSRGQFTATMNSASLNNVQASIIQSSVSDFSACFRWGSAPYLEILSGKAVIDLDNVFNRRSLIPSLQDSLRDVNVLRGKVRLKEMHFSGPLRHPDEWQLETAGELEKVVVDSSSLPGRLNVASGQFRTTTKVITLNNLQTTILGSSLTGTGEITGSFNNIRSAAMSIGGTIRPEAIQWASKTYRLSPEWTVRAPITLSRLDLTWQEGENFSVTGTGTIQQGPVISIDLHHDQNELVIRRFFIEDEDSHASLTLKDTKKELDITFSGTLNHNTLKRMFEQNSFHFGWIRGNLKAHLPLDHLRDFNSEGSLEVTGFVLPNYLNMPVKVDQVTLRTEQQTITIVSGNFSWGNIHLNLKGDIKAAPAAVHLNVDLFADGIKVETIKQALSSSNKEVAQGSKLAETGSRKFPVQGSIRLNFPYISYGNYTAKPFRATLLLDKENIKIVVEEAMLCGISIPGTVTSGNEKIYLDLKPAAVKQSLEPVLSCLTGSNTRITGLFDLNATIKAHGNSEDLVHSLEGKVKFKATEGKIYRYSLLAKIFSLLNITDILKGKLPDLEATGLEYKSITVNGDMQNGNLQLKEGSLNGPTVNMAGQGEINISDKKINLTVLVAPFKTVNDILSHIPIISNIAGRTLISVPVKVSGNLDNPTVIPLAPTAIGEEVLGIMKRTLGLPFKVLEPIISGKK